MGFSAGFYLFHKFVNTEIAQPLGTILCVVTMTSFELLEEANRANLPQGL